MDIQTFLHNLHEEVSCSVCMTKFTDPKQLPCLHSFCLHCLQRIQETSGIRETISCPECRQNFRIPGRAERETTEIAKLDENCVRIQEQAARVKSDVQQFVDCISAAIEAKKLEIFDDVENKMKESLENLSKQRRAIEEQLKIHETAIQKSEILLKRSTSAQIMQPNELFDQIFQQEAHEMQDNSADLDGGRSTAFVFVKNQILFDRVNTEQIGCFRTLLTKTSPKQSIAEGNGIREATLGLEAQIIVTTRSAKEEQCYEGHVFVTVEIRNRQGHDCVTVEQVQDNKDGTYKISYFAKETGTCQASVKVNGEHVHGSPFEVQVQPRQYKPVLSFGQKGSAAGMFNNPWGLAVNEKKEIAVTEFGNHRIQVFNSDGRLLRSIGRKGSQNGEFDRPSGITFHNDSIIVVDNRNHRVQLFTDQGEYVAQFGGKGSIDHQLMFPHGLSVDSDGNIIVAERGEYLIKIFSAEGQFVRKIGTEGFFKRPFHCVQHHNYFIASDRGDHSIKVFNGEGKFLYKFGKQGGGDGEFNDPGCLSVSKTDHLLVCDSGNHRVQVFELSGKFVTAFGQNGSELGKFNHPVSTAVLNDGRIIVSDFKNHRIQIFE